MNLNDRISGLLIEFLFGGAVVAEDGTVTTTIMPKEIQEFARTELNLNVSEHAYDMDEGIEVFTYDNAKRIKREFLVYANKVGLWDRRVDWNDLGKLQEYGIHNLSVLRDIPTRLSLMGISIFTPTYRQLKWWQLILSYFPDMEPLDVVWFASIYHYRELHAAMRYQTPDFKDIDLMISLKPWESEERLNKYLEVVLEEENPSVFTMLEGMQEQQDRILASVHLKTLEMFISQASNMYQGTPWRLPSVTPRDFMLWQEAIEELRKQGDFELESFAIFEIQKVRFALRKQGKNEVPDFDDRGDPKAMARLLSSVNETAVNEELKKLYMTKGIEYETSREVTR